MWLYIVTGTAGNPVSANYDNQIEITIEEERE